MTVGDERITIDPDRLEALGTEPAPAFLVVTNSAYVDRFSIAESSRYAERRVIAYDDGQDFHDLLAREVPDGSHLITILPDCLLHSIPSEVLGRRRLLIMACRSGRTDLAGVEHFLRCGEQTNIAEQERFAESFFEKGEQAEYLTIIDEEYGTSARFNHLSDDYEWHEQLGYVGSGEQQVFPSGEIACFLVPLKVEKLDSRASFDVEGTLSLRGQVIVQSGPPSFLVEDQERIYSRLATVENHALILEVKEGDVVSLEASHPHCRPAAEMLEAMFEVDSRFRRIFEFGFAFNRHVQPVPGNSAMNEVCGGAHGQLHAGLGMLPHTQYHLDMFLAGTKVLGRDGEVVFGGNQSQPRTMNRRRTSMCPCMVTV